MKYIFRLLILLLMVACQSNQENREANDGLKLVWSDEFDYTGKPDPDKWGYELGNGCPTLCGWGNNELQYYTQAINNARVADDKLIIEAQKNAPNAPNPYTSAKLVTKNKAEWKYGRVDVRARLAEGVGTWSAIWMLPSDWTYGDWPKSGEIDIMEHVGYTQGRVYGTIHTEAFNHKKGTQKSDSIEFDDVANAFHEYSISWTPRKIEFMVDGEVFNTFTNNGQGSDYWPYDQGFYLILNVAVGGDWGGKMGVDDSIWPQRMEVDYVRVYQNPETTANIQP